MLASADLITLACPPELIESAITCACRCLSRPGRGAGSQLLGHLRFITAEAAVALAFRRYLDETAVPFEVPGALATGDPESIPIRLGGHRCLLQTTLLMRERAVEWVRRCAAALLKAHALLPLGRLDEAGNKPDDILLFAFLAGEVAASRTEMEQAQAEGKPLALVHPLPGAWARPAVWAPLKDLVMKSECEQALRVELSGQDGGHAQVVRRLELPPRQRVPVPDELYTVTCLRVERRPEARLGIHSPRLGEPYILAPYDWGNLWIEEARIVLSGWMTRADYLHRAVVLNAGMRTPLLNPPAGKCLVMPLVNLNPLKPLLRRVKDWAAGR